jgi:hypothetical protein
LSYADSEFLTGLRTDSSPEGRQRNQAMNQNVQETFLGGVQQRFKEVLNSLGATLEKKPFVLDAPYLLTDRFLQQCIPSVEYPRSDAPSSLRFAGSLPKGHRDPFVDMPSRWKEVTNNTTKKIVAVSQGTLELNYEDLTIPTMTALKDRDDILVVVALDTKGATLSAYTTIPANA